MRCLSLLLVMALGVLTALPEDGLEAAPPRRPQVRRPQVRRPQARRPQARRPMARRPQARRPQARRPQQRPQVRRPQVANRNPNALPNGIAKPNPAANAARTFEVEIPIHEEAKVRKLQLPIAFDTKGRVKTYTAEEQLALKGETPEEQKLTGFKSGFNELKTGDVLQVLMGTPKGKPSPGEKVALSPNGGEVTGTLTKITSKSLTLKVTGTPPAGATAPTNAKPPQGAKNNQAAAKLVLSPDKKQASLVVLKERPAAPAKPGAKAKK